MRWLRRKREPNLVPWLGPQDRKKLARYRSAHPNVVARRIFVKDNGSTSWVECDYPQDKGFIFELQRRFENPPRDWDEVAVLVLAMSGLGERQCDAVQQAVASTVQSKGCYTLEITPQGFDIRDCADSYRTVAEGTF